MIFNVLKRIVVKNNYPGTKEELKEYLVVFLVNKQITVAEYKELLGLLEKE
jgi:hypothetical protein